MSTNLITIENAHVTLHGFGEHFCALKNINFCLSATDHVAILGPNGAGKSTFLRLLAGEVWSDTGGITWYYNGQAEHSPIMARRMTALVSSAEQEQYTRHGWQLSGQDILLTAFSQLPSSPTAGKQIELVRLMAEKLHCTKLLHMQAHVLSQGQLRLLLLGRALLRNPRVLLLDEYLDGLDAPSCENIINILSQLSSRINMVISTHRPQNLVPWINKQMFINEGELSSTPAPRCQSSKQKIITQSASQHASKHAIIDISKATVFINRVAVLHNINWELHAGEHWMIQGKNGAGKSTFLRLLAGDEYPAAGGSIKRHFARLYPQEKNTTKLEHIRKATRLVSDYEQACYGYDLTGLELVLSGLDNVIGTYRDFKPQEVEAAVQILHDLGLSKLEKRRIRSLSTGQLRRLFIARALMDAPEVLLLDEPFSGLDQDSRHQYMDSLEIIGENSCIIMVSHHLSDRLSIINREARLQGGQLSL